MKIGTRITAFSLRHYKLVTGLMAALAIAVLQGAALPSLHLIKPLPESVKNFSRSLSFLPSITVATDPENMCRCSWAIRLTPFSLSQAGAAGRSKVSPGQFGPSGRTSSPAYSQLLCISQR